MSKSENSDLQKLKLVFFMCIAILVLIALVVFMPEISKEEAKNIVLEHARISHEDVERIEVKYIFSNGFIDYEIEVDTILYKYTYVVDSKTGDVMKFGHKLIPTKTRITALLSSYPYFLLYVV